MATMNTQGEAPDTGTANVPGMGSGQPAAGGDGGEGTGAQGDPPAGTGTPNADGTPPADGAPAPDGAGGAGDGTGEPAGGNGEADPAGGDDVSAEAFVAKLPEGITITDDWTSALREFGTEFGLKGKALQKVADFGVQFQQQIQQQMVAEHQQRIEQWTEQSKADPIVGGPNYERNVAIAVDAVAKFGDPELKQAFIDYGLGSHPAFVRAFYRMGKAMQEGGAPHGVGSQAPAPDDNSEAARAARMYARAEKPTGTKPPKT